MLAPLGLEPAQVGDLIRNAGKKKPEPVGASVGPEAESAAPGKTT